MLRAKLLFWPIVAATLVAVAVIVRADDPPAAPAVERDEKIKQIEKQLKELLQQVESLKKETGSAGAVSSATPGGLPAAWIKQMNWRSLGPASMGGRIIDMAVYEPDPSIYWIATASGGLLKTTNNGVTFEHQFDHETTVSLGAVAVAQTDKNIVWVGTGEYNPRNSVSYGDGVYKSVDGGKTWKNMGLKKSFQVGKIAIHPKNPDIVYVGALGRLYGHNEERGLFKTADGGQTWQKVLYVDDKTGVIDFQLNPADPETLLVATWERQRDEFDSHRGEPALVDGYDAYDPIKKWGPGSGIYKTSDGGKSFKKLTAGLPTSPMGRIGLDYYRKDPKIVFAIIDCQDIGKGTVPPPAGYLGVAGQDAPEGGAKIVQVVAQSPADKAGLKVNDVVIAAGDKEVAEYFDLTEQLRGKKKDDKLKLKVRRDKETLELEASLDNPRTGPTGPGSERFALAQILGALTQESETGLRVVRFMGGEDTPAQKAGIEEGDVIKTVDDKPAGRSEELLEQLREKKPDDKVTIQVEREREGKKETKSHVLTIEDRSGGSGLGTRSRTRPNGATYGGQQANIQAHQGSDGHLYGGVYRSSDGGETWTRINSLNPRPMYFSMIRVDPNDERYVYVGGVSLHRSKNGGRTFSEDGGAGVVHPDQHAMWIDPKDGRHILLGCDGGFYVTWDRMEKWDFLNHAAIGQFYHVAVDTKEPYWVYGGLQDNGTWGGPSQTRRSHGTMNEDWIAVAGGDGFVVRVDPFDSDLIYYESQDGNMGRRNLRTGESASIRPRTPPRREGEKPITYRWNWNTPFILSNHNPGIYYCAGNYVFRSFKRGDDLKPISPEIARTGRGTATAIAESPRNADVLYVGTDDGNLWVSRDCGTKWTNLADKLYPAEPGKPGAWLPGPRWVATIEPSRFAEGRVYVAFDAHRSDDDEPYLLVSEDYGQTWQSLRSNLPWGSTRVLREDPTNENLLYCGTEFGLWASIDRGKYWSKLNNNLPTVAVHEVAIHPSGEIIVATHGRSLWALDVTPLRQMSPQVVTAAAHLFQPGTVLRRPSEPARQSMYGTGHRRFYGTNPPRTAQIYYSLNKKAEKASIRIVDYTGRTVRELTGPTEPGLHLVAWDLRPDAPRGGGPGLAGPGGGFRGGAGRRGGPAAATAQPATEPPAATTGEAATGETKPAAPPPAATDPPASAAPAQAAGEAAQARPTPPSGERTGRGPSGAAAAPSTPRAPISIQAGMYRVILSIDGQEFTQSIKIDGDLSSGSFGFGGDEGERIEPPSVIIRE